MGSKSVRTGCGILTLIVKVLRTYFTFHWSRTGYVRLLISKDDYDNKYDTRKWVQRGGIDQYVLL